jgi:hypothetical protein
MKFKVIEDVQVTCDKCNHAFTLLAGSFIHDAWVCETRSMGNEYEHVIGRTGECPRCKASYIVTATAYEYPKDCINYKTEEVKGVTIRSPYGIPYEQV